MTIKHTLRTSPDGKIHTLQNNGIDCTCPFKSSFPMPDKLGQTVFVGQPCNSNCPHFNIDWISGEMDENTMIILGCGHGQMIRIEPTEPVKETVTKSGIVL
jgi:hypothetical protein